MGDPARRRASYADVLAAPPNVVAELIGGQLYTQARPRLRHAKTGSRLGGRLDGFDHDGRDGPGGWTILFEPELHLGGDILVPDLAGWRRETLPALPDAAYLTVAPDWVAEVVSPSTESIDRAEKVPIYAREGVGWIWLLDPDPRTLEVFRLDGESYRVHAVWRDDAVVRAPPFDAIELPLAPLW
ncbi:MAG: Uma2 family endonuclease [Sandaracinaceae bacterium]|nr:Uma2 family endonuclease [Sandaracinaceae bacterium]